MDIKFNTKPNDRAPFEFLCVGTAEETKKLVSRLKALLLQEVLMKCVSVHYIHKCI